MLDFFENSKKNYLSLKEKFILFTFSSLFFIWNTGNVDFKLLIIPTFFIAVYEIYIKKKNFILLNYIIFLLLIILHIFFSSIFNDNIESKFNFRLFSAFSIILLISLVYRDLIIKKLNIIYKLFILIFFIDLVIIGFKLSSKIIKDGNLYLKNLLLSCDNGLFSEAGFFFVENSHFAMITVPFILFKLSKKFSNNYYSNLLFIVLIIVSLISYSTTYLLGIFLSSLLIVVKLLIIKNYNKILVFVFAAIVSISFIVLDKTCNKKVFQTFYSIKNFQESKLDLKKKEEESFLRVNLSTQVFKSNLVVVKKSLNENNFFGVGLNNYEILHKKYKNLITATYIEATNLNSKDASSNLIKILGEFGVFTLIFVFCFFYYFFKYDGNFQAFVFVISLIITQLIRGAGYYNGGFLVCASIIILFVFSNIIKTKKIKEY